jgi:membrane protease YdiL (CAAX protease family)
LPTASPDRAQVELLAPRWHTAALIALIVAVAVTGTVLAHSGSPLATPSVGSRVVGMYLPLLLVNGGLTFYVCRVGRARNALRSLLGRSWDSMGRACTDLALAAAAWLVIEIVEAALATSRNAATVALLPHTVAERAVWVLVASTVAFCEEVVYRGYLQRQLTAFTRRASIAVLLQAFLFGIAHGDQGLAVALRFALYGVMLGALAGWRRSLLPGIACHMGIDIASGLLAR